MAMQTVDVLAIRDAARSYLSRPLELVQMNLSVDRGCSERVAEMSERLGWTKRRVIEAAVYGLAVGMGSEEDTTAAAKRDAIERLERAVLELKVAAGIATLAEQREHEERG